MDVVLNPTEVRVLGSLIEKDLSTPEYYPLSLNALVNACNQKSNRDPMTNLGESEVLKALDSLRFKQFAILSGAGGRVSKYRHALVEKFRFSPSELALLCELLVRGPQTVGELRTRAERMHPFADLAEVDGVLAELAERGLVTKLPVQPGRKEPRFCHLFSGEPDTSEIFAEAGAGRGRIPDPGELERLEQEVAALRQEVGELRQIVADFKKSFE